MWLSSTTTTTNIRSWAHQDKQLVAQILQLDAIKSLWKKRTQRDDVIRMVKKMTWKTWRKYYISICFMYSFEEGYSLLIAPHRSDVFRPTQFFVFSVERKLQRRLKSCSSWFIRQVCFYCTFSHFVHIDTSDFSASGKPKNFFAIFELFCSRICCVSTLKHKLKLCIKSGGWKHLLWEETLAAASALFHY